MFVCQPSLFSRLDIAVAWPMGCDGWIPGSDGTIVGSNATNKQLVESFLATFRTALALAGEVKVNDTAGGIAGIVMTF